MNECRKKRKVEGRIWERRGLKQKQTARVTVCFLQYPIIIAV